MRLLWFMLCIPGTWLVAQQDDLPEFVMTIKTSLTRVPVTVVGGRPQRVLSAADFEIFEDGEQQTISYFESGSDLTLGLVIDCTSSMYVSIKQARQAAETVIRGLGERDKVFVVTFGNNRKPRLLVKPTSNLKKAIRAIKKLEAYGGVSYVWDAVDIGIRQLEKVEGKTALVLISDADDQTSKLSFKNLRAKLGEGFVPFHLIGLNVQSLTNQQRVKQLADVSGGAVRHTDQMHALQALLDEIVSTVQDQYLLGYTPSQTTQRSVRNIVVKDKSGQNLKLEWRRTIGSGPGGS